MQLKNSGKTTKNKRNFFFKCLTFFRKFLSSIGEKDSEYFSKIPENFPNKLSGDFSKLFYSVSCETRTVSHNVKRVPKSVKCFLLNSKYEVCQIVIMNYVPLNIKC